jgi:hypothetical protein
MRPRAQRHMLPPSREMKGRQMNRYESSTPRAALGLSAVAMAAFSIGALVVLPAQFDPASAEPYPCDAAPAITDAPTESAVSTARSDEPAVTSHHERVGLACTTFAARALRA